MSTLKPDIMVNPQDLFAQVANTSGTVPYVTQTPQLGTRAVTGDGREFRFIQAGATALIAGQLLQAPSIISGLQAATLTTAQAALGVVGATTGIQITAASTWGATITTGQFAGGFLITYGSVANGGGQILQISSNAAAASGGTTLTLSLVDPVQVAFTTSTTIDILPNIYASVIQMPTTQLNKAVGVALGVNNNASTATTNGLTALYYGWCQIKGLANVLIQGTPASFSALSASTTTAGAFEETTTSTSASNYHLATNLATGVNGQYGPADLLIS